ncbi:VOC family protein [Tenacibaculum sp. TC6]|uniref:VOC family protein n=1 Tax=Tenacibaculum sp. TC6 TaxID=3423223 RepID=UPI003D36DB85
MKTNTYLHFNGNCEEAMNYYADILGGTITMMMQFKEAPEEVLKNIPDFAKELIMHCTLEVSDDMAILASDYLNADEKFNAGNNFAISLNADDEDEALSVFNGLAEGGTILMPFEDAFWGGKFGMLKDKFGVSWMMSLEDDSQIS